jgi:hypothetical protein
MCKTETVSPSEAFTAYLAREQSEIGEPMKIYV